MISLIFDPLSFVAPLLLDGKSILQELCRLDVSWMNQYLADLLNLQQISISKCYKPENFGPVVVLLFFQTEA